MLVFADGKLHDDEKEPILLILSPKDRLNIIGMHPDENLIVTFPNGMTEKERRNFINEYHKKTEEMMLDGIDGGQAEQEQLNLPGF